MISKFVREQRRYNQRELCKVLECSDAELLPLVRRLKEFGILKAVTASDAQKDMADLIDEDIELTDVELGSTDYYYVFTFVGVVIFAGRVLKCYPKYLLTNSNPKNHFKLAVQVLEKYNTKEQIIRMYNESSEGGSFNLLAVSLFLLQDYFENGSYSNTEDIIETNGSGEILWDKTINETFTFIANNRPYYIDLQTRKRVFDELDYFKRLHECILTIVSKELENADLLDIFEISGVDLSDESLDDFGETDYILYMIEKELNLQFNTQKQLILKTLYTYIAHKSSLCDMECFSVFGTNSFNLVWEDVCKVVYDNQYETKLAALKLPTSLKKEKYDKRLRLKDLIEKPLWTLAGMTATDTLIPDLITIQGNCFVIFDAKYYNAVIEPGKQPKGQPGIESITKQYLYQLVYKPFIEDHNFTAVKNCFLMPTENKEIIDKGEVKLQMLTALGLENIKVRLIPAEHAFKHYLSGTRMSIFDLNL